jgi:hypothetical protein
MYIWDTFEPKKKVITYWSLYGIQLYFEVFKIKEKEKKKTIEKKIKKDRSKLDKSLNVYIKLISSVIELYMYEQALNVLRNDRRRKIIT